MLLGFTTSLKNDGNFRSTFQKVLFQGHRWKGHGASLLEMGELVGRHQGGGDRATSTRGAAGSSLLGMCRDLVVKPALLTSGLYIYVHIHTHSFRDTYTHTYGQIWL